MDEENNQIDDLDDLDDLGLFHKSSLKEKQEPGLPQIVKQSHQIKKTYNEESKTSFIGEYEEFQEIGKGAFANVLKAKKGQQYYAMKVYSLLRLRSQKFFAADGSFANGQEMLENQLDIIKRLDHQNLIKFEEIMYGGTYVYVVGQLCDLGQIMVWDEQKQNYLRNSKIVDYIGTKYELQNLEDITRFIFLQVAQGLQYLHKNDITNRDIKVDNLLCRVSEGKADEIKIADFTTVRYSHDDISFFVSGTPGFRGPEHQFASSDGYSCKASDIWSLGISLYTYYMEFFPFMGESELQIETKALKQELKYNENCPDWMRSLIEKMTRKDWKERIKIEEVISLLMNPN